MTTIFGLARLTASDYQFARQVDQELLYEATQQYLSMVNDAAMGAISTFVEPTPTTNAKERYQLPMVGRMQKTSEERGAKSVARSGSYDVAYPLWQFGDQVTVTDVDMAYMTPQEFQEHIDGAAARAMNAKRHEILYRIFNNTQDTFTDKRLGSLTIEPIANGDGVVYPPVEGEDTTEATEDHYLESGYAATAISDTNNPIKTLVDDLVHHGINRTEDIPIVSFINSAQQTQIESLTNFVPYIPPTRINAGDNTDMPLLPPSSLPGRTIGYVRGYSWINVWPWIPANYIVSVNLAAPQPLKMRVDPAETGLGSGGLVLLPTEKNGVLTFNDWRLRFGIGGANRLSAAVMELGTGGTYTIPTAYQ